MQLPKLEVVASPCLPEDPTPTNLSDEERQILKPPRPRSQARRPSQDARGTAVARG